MRWDMERTDPVRPRYNPVGDELPSEQTQLEKEYKDLLKEHYGISFSCLIPWSTALSQGLKTFNQTGDTISILNS
jgi:hypothetical protein